MDGSLTSADQSTAAVGGGGGVSAASASGRSPLVVPASPAAAAVAATPAGRGVGWLDGGCRNGQGGRGGEDSDIATKLPGDGGRGAGAHALAGEYGFSATAGVGSPDDGIGAGARRCRRSSSLGEEEDDEADSPRPPSKRYRNGSTKTRIACLPLVQVRYGTPQGVDVFFWEGGGIRAVGTRRARRRRQLALLRGSFL